MLAIVTSVARTPPRTLPDRPGPTPQYGWQLTVALPVKVMLLPPPFAVPGHAFEADGRPRINEAMECLDRHLDDYDGDPLAVCMPLPPPLFGVVWG